jgi:17beta-estradiol 17-dehydrogenase / very-long-chain 3-oxoacyl-CoA reductase
MNWNLFFDKLSDGVRNLDFTPHVDPRLMTGLAGLGAFVLLGSLSSPLHTLYKHTLRPRRDLASRYGAKWALVTGASKGIGEAVSYQLAKSGFNIILMDRSQFQMDQVAAKIKADYKVDAKTIAFDFKTLHNLEGV